MDKSTWWVYTFARAYIMLINGKIWILELFMYPGRDLDHSQILMESKLDNDPSSLFQDHKY